MAKKRKCRLTEAERITHERAVALRKMADGQLVGYFDRQYKAGFDAGRIGAESAERDAINKILSAMASVKGIGMATRGKVREVALAIIGEAPA